MVLLTGSGLVVALVVAVAVMIVMVARLKVHAFIALMLTALVLALLSLPLDTIAPTIRAGFAGTLQHIGLIIVFGALIGLIVGQTGAALSIADVVVRWVGRKRPELAMWLMGWIVSIPVFCDSGFIILDPIRKALAQATQRSPVGLAIALSLGLYVSHVFMPPTPGPIAAAASVGLAEQLLLVMGMGAVVSLFVLVPCYLFARRLGAHIEVDATLAPEEEAAVTHQAYEQLKQQYGRLPNTTVAFLPIVAPIGLLACGTVAKVLDWPALAVWQFFGDPIIALAVGVLCAAVLLQQTQGLSGFSTLTQDTLKLTGPILLITAAGGVLGRVISQAGVVEHISQSSQALLAMGILLPFLIAAALKISQGSSTVAIVTTAALMGAYTDPNSLMTTLGFTTPAAAALVVMAIGAGSMTVSHANDSYFWVVTQLIGLSPEQGYRTQTLGSLVAGLSAMLGIGLLSLWLL